MTTANANRVNITRNAKDSNVVITLDRRNSERRSGNPDATDAGAMASPRRKKQRRRHIDPTTCEREYNEQEIQFMRAMDDYKQQSGRMFPTCSEVLEVIRSLGYVQLDDQQIEQLRLDREEIATDQWSPEQDGQAPEQADV